MGRRIIFFIFIFFLFHTSLFAQQFNNGDPFIYKPSNDHSGSRLSQGSIESILNLSVENKLRRSSEKNDRPGFSVERYSQNYKGIPVEHARYNLIKRNGRIISVTGEYYDLKELDTKPALTASAALQYALAEINAIQYAWEQGGVMPTGELVICKNPDSDLPTLTYKFDIYALSPLSRDWVYVNANTGKVILRDAILKHELGIADTRYSKRQNIETTNSGSYFKLKDETRGNGIETFNLDHGTSYFSASDFTDLDNNWSDAEFNTPEKDNSVLDAHFGVTKTYDYFRENHNRNSFDDNGAKINVYSHYGENYINAFWNGEVLTFGDGGYSSSKGAAIDPLTTVDIVAHEYAHAICQYSAGLIYKNESGAINESLSDIWGVAVKYYTDSTKNTWLIGDETNYTFRSLSNPKDRSQPDTYFGDYWHTGSSDHGGVHTNSGVMNYWFYLLVRGGSGLNDHGDSYSISPIGFEKASDIVYRLETIYLTANSEYKDARRFSALAAEDLFGENSSEVQQCLAAWDAVGVYDFDSAPSGLAVSVTSDSAGVYVSLSWVDNSDWESGFEIYRYPTSSDSVILVNSVSANQTAFYDTLDATGGSFAYKIRAVDETKKSGYSNEANILAGLGVVVMEGSKLETCSGILLDPGGLNDYPDNSDLTLVIYPNDSGKYVTLDFEEFNLESWRDYLRVYEGNSISAPQTGNYTGDFLPEFISSSSADGSLTLRFISDGATTAPGFQLNIGCLDTIPLPDLTTYSPDSSLQSTVAGQTIILDIVLENLGNKRSSTSLISAFLSPDIEINSTDIFIGSWNSYNLNPGQSTHQFEYLEIPADVESGDYHLLWKVDYNNIINESNEFNNTGNARIAITESELDLELSNLSFPSSMAAGNNISVTLTLKNPGNSDFQPGVLEYFLSRDSNFDPTDVYLAEAYFSTIYSNNSATVNLSVKIPDDTEANNYYLIAVLDPQNEVKEKNETNNVISYPIKTDPFGSYFIMPHNGRNVIRTCSGSLYDNGKDVDYEAYSDGILTIFPGEPGKYAQLTFSDFSLFNGDELEIYNGTNTFSPSFGAFSVSEEIPVIYSTDETGALTLRFHSDNNSYRGFEATISCLGEIPVPDLAIRNFQLEEPMLTKTINNTFSFSINNEMSVPASSIPFEIYLSKDPLGSNAQSILIDTIEMVWLDETYVTGNFVLPDLMEQGDYYLWVEINKNQTITETDYGNNLSVQPVYVKTPQVDLEINSITPNNLSVYRGESLSINLKIINNGPDNVTGNSGTHAFITRDTSSTENLVSLETHYFSSLNPNADTVITFFYDNTSNLDTGLYYIVGEADYHGDLIETNELNNRFIVPLRFIDYGDEEVIRMPVNENATVTACNQIVTDDGGLFDSYSNNSNGILTIYPGINGAMVNLEFTSFALETCCDYLEIYDGESTSSELIGTYGSISPIKATASNPSGALTLRFYSDGSVTYDGFAARVTCNGDYQNLVDLNVYNLTIENENNIGIGSIINLQLNVENLGEMNSFSNIANFYLSLDQAISADDTHLGSENLGDLAPGARLQINPVLQIPSNLDEGDYYLLTEVRGGQNYALPLENDLNNNIAVLKIHLSGTSDFAFADDEDLPGILAYPNPLRDNRLLTIEITCDATMFLFSMEGRMLQKERLTSGKNYVNIENLPRGSYLIKCISQERSEDIKILVE